MGTIKNNMREKRGVYTWKPLEEGKTGGVYDGDYESNKKHGKGTMKYPDGGVYEGKATTKQRKIRRCGSFLCLTYSFLKARVHALFQNE